MMGWLKRKLRSWLMNEGCDIADVPQRLVASREVDGVEGEPVLNFKVYSAIGGKVVEFRHYDRQKDRSFNQTYIITNDQDFGERIAKIATMESLKS